MVRASAGAVGVNTALLSPTAPSTAKADYPSVSGPARGC
jgi:hypothetical protein